MTIGREAMRRRRAPSVGVYDAFIPNTDRRYRARQVFDLATLHG